MAIMFDVMKEKGTRRYFVYNIHLPVHALYTFDNKRKALHKAAEIEKMSYRDYMRERRKLHAKS